MAEEAHEPGGETRPVIPINIDKFEAWIRSIKSKYLIDKELKDRVVKEDVEKAVDIGIAAVMPWLTDAGLVVMASDPTAFKLDVRRKLVGIAETVKQMIMTDIRECIETISLLTESEREVSSPLMEEAKKSEEQYAERINKCILALRKGRQGILGFLIALDILFGAIQANLPVSLMSNVIKGRSGFFTD